VSWTKARVCTHTHALNSFCILYEKLCYCLSWHWVSWVSLCWSRKSKLKWPQFKTKLADNRSSRSLNDWFLSKHEHVPEGQLVMNQVSAKCLSVTYHRWTSSTGDKLINTYLCCLIKKEIHFLTVFIWWTTIPEFISFNSIQFTCIYIKIYCANTQYLSSQGTLNRINNFD